MIEEIRREKRQDKVDSYRGGKRRERGREISVKLFVSLHDTDDV